MILVAGGTGTLGSRLVSRLVARGVRVRVLARNHAAKSATREATAELVAGDVRDRATVVRAVDDADMVVSAIHGFDGGRNAPAHVDRDGNGNLIDAAASAGAAMVLVSIVGASPDSALDLFRMKHGAEQRLRKSGVPWTVVRATAYLETWVGLLELTAARSSRPVVFGRGDNPISFVSADDVAALVERVVMEPPAAEVLEIGGPEDLSMNQVAAAVQRAAGRPGAPRHVPRPMLQAMALAMRGARPDLARRARAALLMDTDDMTLDPAPIRARYPGLPATTLANVLAARTNATA